MKSRAGVRALRFHGLSGPVLLADQVGRPEFVLFQPTVFEPLTTEVGEQSAMLAGFLGALKDAVGQASGGAGTVEAPIAGYPNFEHLEAEGQWLMPEQLKVMLKTLARSNLLRGDAR